MVKSGFAIAKQFIAMEWEKKYILDTLKRTKGNISLASKMSGLNRGVIYRLLKKHDLKRGKDF